MGLQPHEKLKTMNRASALPAGWSRPFRPAF
jgi:hypothetical protein